MTMRLLPHIPPWIESIPYAVRPPFYGLGAADLVGRPIVAFDCESYLIPEAIFQEQGKKAKSFKRRKTPRPVVASFWAQRNVLVPALLAEGDPDDTEVWEYRNAWSAVAKPVTAAAVLRDLLLNDNITLAGHNILYDFGVFCHHFPTLLPLVFRAIALGRVIDTKIRETLLLIHAGRLQDEDDIVALDLGVLTKKYLGIDISADKKGADIWRLRYSELDGVPLRKWPAKAKEYARDDAEYTGQVAIAQAPIHAPVTNMDGFPATTEQGGIINEQPQMRAAWSLYLHGLWGMRVDNAVHEAWGKEIDKVLRHAQAVARAAGFLRPNGSVDQGKLRELVVADCTARGVEVARTDPSGMYPTGQVKIDKEVLVNCTSISMLWELPKLDADGKVVGSKIEKIHPLKVWGDAAFMVRMRSTYFNPSSLGIDYAMLYDFNALVATGRCSGRGPNMQNPPRDGEFREQFIPRPGMVFCSTDYAALELRTLAQLHFWFFGRSALRDAFRLGKDPHAMLGAELAGMDAAQFADLEKRDKKAWKNYRQASKSANFGVPGGLGPETFVEYAWTTYGVDLGAAAVAAGFCTENTHENALAYAKKLIKLFKRLWPEAGLYMDAIGEDCAAYGSFTFVQPMSWRLRGGCGYCNGNNTGFQGLAGDGAKEADWRVTVMCYLGEAAMDVFDAQGAIWPEDVTREQVLQWCRDLHGCRPVLFIHDEILTEGPEATAHIWGPSIAAVQVAVMRVYTPDVPHVVEPALMRRWYKNADPVYDASGKLIPWERPPKEKK